ncbi:hypothetical protein Tsubulata_050811, partial [Turnera subulata]
GKKGASLNRALEAQAIGGKPPYLESQIEFVGSLTAFRGEFVLACRDRALACLDTRGRTLAMGCLTKEKEKKKKLSSLNSHLLTISFAAAPSTATPHPHLLLCLSATASLPLSSGASSSSSSSAASFSSSSDVVFLFLSDCESLHSFPPPVATSLTVGRQLGDTVLKSKKMEPMNIAGKSKEDASLPKAHSRNRIGCKQPNTQFAHFYEGIAIETFQANMAYELHGRLAGNVSIITGENIKPSYGGDDEAFLRKEAKKSKNGQAPHSEWCNYDDLNETSECFSCGWPMRDDGTFSRSTNDGTQVAVTFDEEGLEGDLFGGKVMQSLSTKLRDSRYLL